MTREERLLRQMILQRTKPMVDKLEAAVQELQPLLHDGASADFRSADVTNYDEVAGT